jgi:hypothetical protein
MMVQELVFYAFSLVMIFAHHSGGLIAGHLGSTRGRPNAAGLPPVLVDAGC